MKLAVSGFSRGKLEEGRNGLGLCIARDAVYAVFSGPS